MLTERVGACPEEGKFLVSIDSSKSTPFIAKLYLSNKEENFLFLQTQALEIVFYASFLLQGSS